MVKSLFALSSLRRGVSMVSEFAIYRFFKVDRRFSSEGDGRGRKGGFLEEGSGKDVSFTEAYKGF